MQTFRASLLITLVLPGTLLTAIPVPVSSRLLAAENPQADPEKRAVGLIRSARSGPWSVAATWEGGKVPGAAARVQVRTGHTVVYDVKSEQPIRMVHVAGTLTFAPEKDTRLDVGLIKIQAGEDASEEGFDCGAHLPEAPATGPRPALEVGTPGRPIEANRTAVIRLIDLPGVDKNSWPAIVCCGGRMDFHGAPLNRTWVKLGETAKKDEQTVTLAEPVRGWRSGDRVILTATKARRSGEYRRTGVETEERIVRAIEGTKLTLDSPLGYEHYAAGDYRAEVANLSRNVVIESAEPEKARGHTMYHRGSAGSISYAEFRHLGKENTLGRYSLHFHLAGDTMRGSSVIGASIWDSGNRWLTIHGTNYLVVRDCVGYRSVGHGFFLEDGTEVCNVLDRNLAVQAVAGKPLKGQSLPFDRNDGAGFWWANSLNTFTRNVACENETYGYRFEATKTSQVDLALNVLQPDGTRQKVDVRTLPFIRFEDNECHSDGLYGFNLGEGVDRVGPDQRHPFVIRNMKIWATHYGFRGQSPSVLLENMRIHRCRYGIYHPNFDRHVYRNLTISETPDEPFSSSHADNSIQYGGLTVDGLVFENIHSTYGILIAITHYNGSGTAVSHFRNVKLVNWTGGSGRALTNQYRGQFRPPPTPRGVPVYFHDYFGPNRHAKVVSTGAMDLIADGSDYRDVAPLTGDGTRAVEVRDVQFPQLLDPVDDRAPATVITHVSQPAPGSILVRGTTSDNGAVKKVLVNGREAKATAGNFGEWEVMLDRVDPRGTKLAAYAEDSAGNVEKLPHIRSMMD
jgi:G8 domain-containing protein